MITSLQNIFSVQDLEMIHIENEAIKIVSSHKHFGLILTPDLDWHDHMDPFQVWPLSMATHTKSIAGGHWWAIENRITAHDLKSVYKPSSKRISMCGSSAVDV